MKKTIAILLATAGIAMAGSSGMMDITMDSHAYSMGDLGLTDIGSKNVTVALQLDWKALTGVESDTSIFRIAGDSNRGSSGGTLGMGVDYTSTGNRLISMTTGVNNNLASNNNVARLTITPDSTLNVTLAVLVYTAKEVTANTSTAANIYLYLWGEGSDEPITLQANTSGSTSTSQYATYIAGHGNYKTYINNYDGININSILVDKAEVYDEFIDATQADEIALEIYKNAGIGSGTGSDTTVPEPATATLSLLALGALAARRRRK